MIKIISAMLLLLVTVACDDQINENLTNISDGTYIGIFCRTPAWQQSDTSNVTISFHNNSWTGYGDKINFPVLGEGTYRIENELIIFTNLTEVISGIDTTLVLSGEFQFKISNTSIEFYRYYYNPTWGWDMPDEDHYRLFKNQNTVLTYKRYKKQRLF